MAAAGALKPFAKVVSLRALLPVLSNALGAHRSFAAASDSSRDGDQERGPGSQPPGFDPKYRSPTEVLWPASKHQERFASKVQLALETALLHNAGLRDVLVQRLGFAVKDVRMSPDNLKAFIQWDSITGQAAELSRELRTQSPRLRAAVAAALRARNVPQLVFRHDGLSPKQQEVEDVFRRLDEEAAADAEAAAAAGAAGGAGAAEAEGVMWADIEGGAAGSDGAQRQERRQRRQEPDAEPTAPPGGPASLTGSVAGTVMDATSWGQSV